MKVIERIPITLSATTGDITTARTGNLTGPVVGIHITYGSATDTGFATTAGISVVSETTGQTVWSETLSTLATTTVHINRITRQVQKTSAGVSNTATESLVREPFYIGNERLVINCTSVGAGTRSATLNVLMG